MKRFYLNSLVVLGLMISPSLAGMDEDLKDDQEALNYAKKVANHNFNIDWNEWDKIDTSGTCDRGDKLYHALDKDLQSLMSETKKAISNHTTQKSDDPIIVEMDKLLTIYRRFQSNLSDQWSEWFSRKVCKK